jgi:hypothetical protein
MECCRCQQGLAVSIKPWYDCLIQHILLTDSQQARLTHKAEHKVGVICVQPAAAHTPHTLDACRGGECRGVSHIIACNACS